MEEVEHRSSLHDHCESDVRIRLGTTLVEDLKTKRIGQLSLSFRNTLNFIGSVAPM